MMRQEKQTESSNTSFSEDETRGKSNQQRVSGKRSDAQARGFDQDEFCSPARKVQRVDKVQRNSLGLDVQPTETYPGSPVGRVALEGTSMARTSGRENPAIERLAQLERERQQILSSLRTDRTSVNQLLFRPPQPAPNAAAFPASLGYGRGLPQTIESAILAQSAANPSIIDQLRRLQALNSVSGASAYPIQNQGLQALMGFPLPQSQLQLNPSYEPTGPSLVNILGFGLGRDGVSSAVTRTLQSQGRGRFPADMQTGFAPPMTQNSQASSLPAVSAQSALIARNHTGIPLSLPVILAQPLDEVKLSSHQVLLRHQIEAFKASEDDVTTHTRGRNKPITLGQVGIRCRHCSKLPVARRQKGSTYFPATLMGLYQAAQNMSTSHMQNGICTEMPESIKQEFGRLLTSKVTSSGAGRPYWAESAKNLGLVDTEEGIRFIRDLRPAAQFGNPPPIL